MLLSGYKYSDYSQLSDYTVRLQLCRLIKPNTADYAPITFEEIVIVMITHVIAMITHVVGIC